ncbi:P43 5S RNA-binding protein-like isoform X3 [Hyla sarda]|uniref:P43 5S RNA-binding protein-like isoform X3 n=1 Tax=Hyla sarda TaxID=327740 RepID=UPI0024C355D4|nr:P43 5S RNA-binding protein-like isoform X3 [Hyla sarda]
MRVAFSFCFPIDSRLTSGCSFDGLKKKTTMWRKPWRCDRPGCGKAFFHRPQFLRHWQKHLGLKKYICPSADCRAAFMTKDNLKRHRKYKHAVADPFKCSEKGCTKTFRKKKALKQHLPEHGGEPQFRCDQPGCEWKSNSKAKLAGHIRRHNGYRCPFQGCQTTSPTWSALQKHRKTHQVDFKCAECKKPFKNKSILRRHKLTHMIKPPVYTCPREDCKQTFTMVFNLTHHVRKNHLCLQPYRCYHAGCERTFAMRESLLRHLVVHDPERKKLKLKFNLNPKKRNMRRAHRPLPIVEQNLSRLFNLKLGFRRKIQLESNLSGLFNERKLRDPAEPEVNLSDLFQLPPARARTEKAA